MLTFMLTCVTCTSDVTSLGWGGGDVNVHVSLRQMHISLYVNGVGGEGMLTSKLTCDYLRLPYHAVPRPAPTGHVTPKLMRIIRVWRCKRWMNSTTKGLMEVTASSLEESYGTMSLEKKIAPGHRSTKHFKIPEEF